MKDKSYFLGSYSKIEECLETIRDIGINGRVRVDIHEEDNMLEAPPHTQAEQCLSQMVEDAGCSAE